MDNLITLKCGTLLLIEMATKKWCHLSCFVVALGCVRNYTKLLYREHGSIPIIIE